MLRTAPFAEEACAQIEALINRQLSSNDNRPTPAAQPSTNPDQAPDTINEPEDQLEHAIRINKQHWATRNRPVSADTLREQLHIGASRARELTAILRALDRAAVETNQQRHPTNLALNSH